MNSPDTRTGIDMHSTPCILPHLLDLPDSGCHALFLPLSLSRSLSSCRLSIPLLFPPLARSPECQTEEKRTSANESCISVQISIFVSVFYRVLRSILPSSEGRGYEAVQFALPFAQSLPASSARLSLPSSPLSSCLPRAFCGHNESACNNRLILIIFG